MAYSALLETETTGRQLALAPGEYEFVGVDVGGSLTLEFLAPDDTWVAAADVELTDDGSVPIVIPNGSKGVRAVIDTAGAQAWLRPSSRSYGG